MDWEKTVGIGGLFFIAEHIKCTGHRKTVLWELKNRNRVWRYFKFNCALFLSKAVRERVQRAFTGDSESKQKLLNQTAADLDWLLKTVLPKQVSIATARDLETSRLFHLQCRVGEELFATFSPGSIVWIEYQYREQNDDWWSGYYGAPKTVKIAHEIPVSVNWPAYQPPRMDSALWHSPSFLNSPHCSGAAGRREPFQCHLPVSAAHPLAERFPESIHQMLWDDVQNTQLHFVTGKHVRGERDLHDVGMFGCWELSPLIFLPSCRVSRSVCLTTAPEFSHSYFQVLLGIVAPFIPIRDLVVIVAGLAGCLQLK